MVFKFIKRHGGEREEIDQKKVQHQGLSGGIKEGNVFTVNTNGVGLALRGEKKSGRAEFNQCS